MARASRRALPVRGARAVGVLAGRCAYDIDRQGAHHLPWSEEGEREKPRTLSELEVRVIKQWYVAKDRKLVGERGNILGRHGT